MIALIAGCGGAKAEIETGLVDVDSDGSVGKPGPSDTTAPETTLTGTPPASTTSGAASFSFSSSEQPSTFECRLDAEAYANCSTPKSYASLAAGTHTFFVRAKDAAGNIDASPATYSWQVTENSSICSIDPPDGHAAIAQAISSCPNNTTVQFPPGKTYHQTDTIQIANRVGLTIDGNGSTFLRTVANLDGQYQPQWQLNAVTQLTLKNMTIQGSFVDPGPRHITAGNQYNHGIHVVGASDTVTIGPVTIKDVFGDLIAVSPEQGNALGTPPRNVRIKNLTGSRPARQGVAFIGVIGAYLEDSTISNCFYICVDVETDVKGEKTNDIHILRNKFSGFNLSAVAIEGPMPSELGGYGPPNAGDLDNLEVRGNATLTASDTCWPPVIVGEKNVVRGPISNVVVADNTLQTQGDGIQFNDVTSGSITNNQITLTKGPHYCDSPAVPLRLTRTSSSVVVSGNTPTTY